MHPVHVCVALRTAGGSRCGTSGPEASGTGCVTYGLRHRIILNFEAQAEGIGPDRVLLDLLEKVPEKDAG